MYGWGNPGLMDLPSVLLECGRTVYLERILLALMVEWFGSERQEHWN